MCVSLFYAAWLCHNARGKKHEIKTVSLEVAFGFYYSRLHAGLLFPFDGPVTWNVLFLLKNVNSQPVEKCHATNLSGLNDTHMCVYIHIRQKVKSKAVSLQAWSGPEGYRKLTFPDFMTTAQDGGKVVSLTHRPP